MGANPNVLCYFYKLREKKKKHHHPFTYDIICNYPLDAVLHRRGFRKRPIQDKCMLLLRYGASPFTIRPYGSLFIDCLSFYGDEAQPILEWINNMLSCSLVWCAKEIGSVWPDLVRGNIIEIVKQNDVKEPKQKRIKR